MLKAATFLIYLTNVVDDVARRPKGVILGLNLIKQAWHVTGDKNPPFAATSAKVPGEQGG